VVGGGGAQWGGGLRPHNDAGCAVANSLVAVERGADMVQGTINGYGERCGNADLCAIIPALKLKMHRDCVSDRDLAKLTDTARFVAELCNISPDPHQPYVGHNAFAHKGGMHVAGVERDPRTFEHIEPALVGNASHVLVSELSGRATIGQRIRELGYPAQEEKGLADRVLKRVKDKEYAGYHYEAADASFELLLRAELGLKVELFHLETFRIIVEKREDGATVSEATIKVRRPKGTAPSTPWTRPCAKP
jgi:2-isopropylmalate synthase